MLSVDATEPPRHAMALEVVACHCLEIPDSPPGDDTVGLQAPYAIGGRLQYDHRLAGRWSVGALAGYEYVDYVAARVPPDRASVGLLGGVVAYRSHGEWTGGGLRIAGGFAYAYAQGPAATWRTPGSFLEVDAEITGRLTQTLDLFLDVGLLRMRSFRWGSDRPRFGATWSYFMFAAPLSGSLGVRYRF